jgi:phosphoglycerate dehydrogenase-like enzyme
VLSASTSVVQASSLFLKDFSQNFSFVHYNIQLSMHEATMPPSKMQGTMDGFVVGIIGMGDMGKMYARRLSEAGWR